MGANKLINLHDYLSPQNLNNPALLLILFITILWLCFIMVHNINHNKVTALYQAINPVRLDLMLGIQKNKPSSIQQLAKAYNRCWLLKQGSEDASLLEDLCFILFLHFFNFLF